LKLALLQYFRFKRQCVCVDEFRGADIIADTGKEIIEIEVKVTKSDLINGEKAKATKHLNYKMGGPFNRNRPNKFMFCVPEKLVDVALGWAAEINECYGVIGFDAEEFERLIQNNEAIWWLSNNYFLRIAKSPKRLHENYKDDLRWSIAKRASAKIASITEELFKNKLQALTHRAERD